ncbi:hypothetical protein PHLCEN_2v1749 [Hermanssonia centrifuga]|uniref:Uncharacterized protein n=1 Tax=Hermanssonia centrifuga TaxID=98765 RepID=A0A2R6RW46_9APHY|nr:hypothetical protein PHLCEN_2v1749 [Hermanssonia centrifuga]
MADSPAQSHGSTTASRPSSATSGPVSSVSTTVVAYINFTSVNPLGNPPAHYTQYSTFFVLTGMSGSFASPVPSDTSTRPVPSTVASPPSTNITSTVVIINSVNSTSTSSSAVVPSTSTAQTSPESSSSGGSAPPAPTNSASSSASRIIPTSWHGTLVPLLGLAWIAASAPFLL